MMGWAPKINLEVLMVFARFSLRLFRSFLHARPCSPGPLLCQHVNAGRILLVCMWYALTCKTCVCRSATRRGTVTSTHVSYVPPIVCAEETTSAWCGRAGSHMLAQAEACIRPSKHPNHHNPKLFVHILPHIAQISLHERGFLAQLPRRLRGQCDPWWL